MDSDLSNCPITNQQKSGNLELEKQLDAILDEYENRHKLKFPDIIDEDISQYLNMSRDYIEALSKEARYEIAIKLVQFSFYIQRLLNREKARVNWCNSCIYSLCASHWNEYDKFIKIDIKMNIIAKENEVLRKIIKIKNRAQVNSDNLDGLSHTLKNLADILARSAYGKE